MQRLQINKESTSKVLEEKITVYLEPSDVKKYVKLLRRTWPKTKIEFENKRYA